MRRIAEALGWLVLAFLTYFILDAILVEFTNDVRAIEIKDPFTSSI